MNTQSLNVKSILKAAVLCVLMIISEFAQAKIEKSKLAYTLYPQNIEDQEFISKFFEVMEVHDKNDPFFMGLGPSIHSFNLNNIKFALMFNETTTTVDLAIFNWNLPIFSNLNLSIQLSQFYGKPVYLLKQIDKKSISSQGGSAPLLTAFSYINGATHIEKLMKQISPGQEISKDILDSIPHPDFMERSHPLRQALGAEVLVLLSPSKNIFFSEPHSTREKISELERDLDPFGGYLNVALGMQLHEMFHVKDSIDRALGNSKSRTIAIDIEALKNSLKADSRLRALILTYTQIIFSFADNLEADAAADSSFKEKLQDLQIVIQTLKSEYPNVWNFIWTYEYTEGFAEYSSASSMIRIGVVSFKNEIKNQKNDVNNFTYRTGAIAGLTMFFRIKKMSFQKNEDHLLSAWEIVLQHYNIHAIGTVDGVIAKYHADKLDEEKEIGLVLKYEN